MERRDLAKKDTAARELVRSTLDLTKHLLAEERMKQVSVVGNVDMDLSEWRQRVQSKSAHKAKCSKAGSKRMILGQETVVREAMAEEKEEAPVFLLLKVSSTARDAGQPVPVKVQVDSVDERFVHS